MKQLLKIIFFIPLITLSQNLEKELDSITTTSEAKAFIKENKMHKGKVYTFNKEKHKTRLADDLFKLSKGGKKVIDTEYNKTYYKIIDKSTVAHWKFNIIVFNAANTDTETIITKRNKVLAQYKEGYRFKDLAKHYSVGPTAKMGGDTGWIKPGDMSSAFDEIAFNENLEINEAFFVDDAEHKKYYLVIKTENKTPIEEITVLKLTESIK